MQFKTSKFLKLLNSVAFIQKTLVNQVYVQIDHFDLLSQCLSEWRQTSKLVNLKISAKVRVCDTGQNLKITKTS